jgi:hypothetical protein
MIDVAFECCWRRGSLSLAEIKGSPTRAFVCPTCGSHVRYSPYDLAQLIGKDPEDGPLVQPDLTDASMQHRALSSSRNCFANIQEKALKAIWHVVWSEADVSVICALILAQIIIVAETLIKIPRRCTPPTSFAIFRAHQP